MSREIKRRIILNGQLECVTPVHVGGLESTSRSDLPLGVNGSGKFYIPGTSLAGPMRAWCTEMWDEPNANAVWGYQTPNKTDDGQASYITVEDAVIPEEKISPEVRDGVGIDRYTGTAADRIKFDREILPAGTFLPFCLVHDEQPGDTAGARMLASLLLALQDGEIRFGAGKSRGLGKLRLTGTRTTEHILGTRQGILNVLKGEPSRTGGLEVLCKDWEQQRRVRPLITISIAWCPVGPLMVKAGVDGAVVDTLPLVSRQQHSLRLVLPGSSSKGALRSHAERIMATLLHDTPSRKDIGFLEQIAAYPLVETLFGARNTDEHDDDDAEQKGEALLGLSPLAVDDCFSETQISQETWQHILGKTPEQTAKQEQPTTPDNEKKDKLPDWTKALPTLKKNADGQPYLDPAVHVAIDRWTGGVAGDALFSVLEPWNFKWGSLDLSLDLNRLARHRIKDADQTREDVALAAMTLLLAVIDDFVRGELPLGFATNRGFGTIRCESITVTLPELSDDYAGLAPKVLQKLSKLKVWIENGKLQFAGADDLATAWMTYLSGHGLGGKGMAA